MPIATTPFPEPGLGVFFCLIRGCTRLKKGIDDMGERDLFE